MVGELLVEEKGFLADEQTNSCVECQVFLSQHGVGNYGRQLVGKGTKAEEGRSRNGADQS